MKYDIIAVIPKTPATLHQACTQLDVDLISIEYCEDIKNYLLPKRHSIKAAKDRGIYFEFNYAPVLEDKQKMVPKFAQAMYSMLAHTAHCGNLNSVTPNIVISSGSRKAKFLRSSRDIINFLQMFELDAAKAHTIVTK